MPASFRSLCFGVLLAAPLAVNGETSLVLEHSGFVLGASDQPVTSSALPLAFAIFPGPTGGVATWSGACSVAVRAGYFTARLGDGTCGADLLPSLVPVGAYLQVTVDGIALEPRLAVSNVPNAANAANAAALSGQSLADLDARYAKVGGSAPGLNQVLKWSGSYWSAGNDENAGGTVTSVAVAAPLTISQATTTPSIALPAASASVDGYLAKTDYQAFAAKVATTDGRLSDARAPNGTASGDLSGTYPSPLVAKLQGRAVSAAAPTGNQILRWNATTSVWEPSTENTYVSGAIALPANGLTVGTNQLVVSGGNVGIGSTSPGASLDLSARTDAARLPAGTTAQRAGGANGALRFNTDLGVYETYLNGFWFRQEPLLALDATKTKVPFNYSGGDQNFVVPAGVTSIFVKVWGAGGAGGTPGGWSYGSAGGAGGFSRGLIPVTPNETLVIRVGQHGNVNQALGYGYGGGASAAVVTADNRYGGGGGGYSGVFRGSAPLVIAGGGGGGGSSRTWTGNVGGAGGGLVGQHGESPYDGKYSYGGTGGSQGAGGSSANGSTGTQYQGGHAANACYGGGGGGGYWGGGGGGYSESNTMAGGGGGSGYLGATVLFGLTQAGTFQVPPMVGDPDFPQGGSDATMHAHGGSPSGAGGHGYVVVYY